MDCISDYKTKVFETSATTLSKEIAGESSGHVSTEEWDELAMKLAEGLSNSDASGSGGPSTMKRPASILDDLGLSALLGDTGSTADDDQLSGGDDAEDDDEDLEDPEPLSKEEQDLADAKSKANKMIKVLGDWDTKLQVLKSTLKKTSQTQPIMQDLDGLKREATKIRKCLQNQVSLKGSCTVKDIRDTIILAAQVVKQSMKQQALCKAHKKAQAQQ